MKLLTSALFGAVFGLGLLISGMTDPARVLGFLDVTGAWNPALAFVMGGAVLTAAPAFALARRGVRPLLGGQIALPDRFRFNAGLFVGAAIFGLGWGLVGLCPGPSLVLLGQDAGAAGVFVISLVIGSWLARRLGAHAAGSAPVSPD